MQVGETLMSVLAELADVIMQVEAVPQSPSSHPKDALAVADDKRELRSALQPHLAGMWSRPSPAHTPDPTSCMRCRRRCKHPLWVPAGRRSRRPGHSTDGVGASSTICASVVCQV